MNTRTILYGMALFLALAYSQVFMAQELPKIIPPSPETATILQHSPINVSLYTGTPNLSVPFYNISHKGIEIPVSISYSSDGIRVENIASSVGLGWSLSAGGLVSRTINKLPDDSHNGYATDTEYTIADFHTRPGGPLPMSAIAAMEYYAVNFPFDVSPNSQTAQLQDINGHGKFRDYEPDTFNYSFLGYSGRFFYDQEAHEFVQAPLTDMKIETVKEGNIITGFKFTDSKGIIYSFGKVSNQRDGREMLQSYASVGWTSNGGFSNTAPYSSETLKCAQSWMLMDIFFPDSTDSIEFDYTIEPNVKTFVLADEYIMKATSCFESGTNFTEKRFDQPKIASIKFPQGEVQFINEIGDRTDLNNSHALKEIKLLNRANETIKKMRFHTSYFISDYNQLREPYAFDNIGGNGLYRLRLDSLSIQNASSQKDGVYKFVYNSKKLPNRFSRAIDYFGYYNGKDNATLVPKTFMNFTVPTYQGTADRKVYPDFTTASVLEKVIYPTGGYDEFVWENNRIGLFAGDLSSYDHQQKDEAYFFNDFYLFYNTVSQKFERQFTIPEDTFPYVEFDVMLSGCEIINNIPDFSTSSDFDRPRIFKKNGSVWEIYSSNNILSQPHFLKELVPGEYMISVKPKHEVAAPTQTNVPGTNVGSFSVHVKWHAADYNNIIYSGLRIKEIKTFEKESAPAFSKSYEYNLFNSATPTSSGRIGNVVDMLFEQYPYYCNSNVPSGYRLTGKSLSESVITKGSYVGYTNVIEKFNGGAQGYNRYTYSYADTNQAHQAYGNVDYGFNDLIPQNCRKVLYNDWLCGNLLKMETFDRNGKKLLSKRQEYETTQLRGIDDFGIQVMNFPPFPVFNGSLQINHFWDISGVSLYGAVTEQHRLKKAIETKFFESDSISNSTNFTYYPESFNVKTESTQNSLGETLIKKYSYAGEAGAVNMISKHMISIPLLTQDYKNDDQPANKISENRVIYKAWGPDVYAPEIIEVGKGNLNSEVRIRYEVVDESTGSPLQLRQENGIPITYIWGYHKTQPVAKIENVTYAEVQQYVSEIQTASNTNNNEVGLIAKLNELRIALPNAMVTTYTYKPLLGIASITDPKGDKITYHYDNFGRLQFVRDRDGNILSENQYHYRPQN